MYFAKDFKIKAAHKFEFGCGFLFLCDWCIKVYNWVFFYSVALLILFLPDTLWETHHKIP